MFCFKSKQKDKTKKNIEQTIEINKYSFSLKEFEMYKQKFERMSNGPGITKDEFKKHMRVSEFKMLGFVADRIYDVMNTSRNGCVILDEYLTYTDVQNYGSAEDKAKLSFVIIAGVDCETITYKAFKKWLISAMKMKNLNTGEGISISETDIQEYFQEIDKNNDGVIDFQEYLEALKNQSQFKHLTQVLEHDLTERLNVPSIEDFKREDPQYKQKIKLLEGKIFELIAYLEEIDSHVQSSLADIRVGIRASEKKYATLKVDKNFVDPRRCTALIQSSVRNTQRLRPCQKYEKIQDALKSLLDKLERIQKGENIEDDDDVVHRQFSRNWARTIPKKVEAKKNEVIYWGDDDWNLILNMMLGIQKSVKETVAGSDCFSKVTSDMFIEKVKHKLLRSQVKSNKTFKFRDYAPSIFERIRKLYGIKPGEYIRSLGMEKIVHALVANEFSSLTGMCTTGKSGSFFYYSDDGKYMLKTLSRQEYLFFHKFLPDYYFHLYKNPHTLITRFFGFHKIIVCSSHKEIYFVVMGNLFKGDYEIDIKFDLKGSSLGRLTAAGEDKSIARKDNNFVEEGLKISIGKKRKEYIIEQLKKDVEVLQRNMIIDYSLLLGISKVDHIVPKKQGFAIFNEVDDGGMISKTGKDLYFLGVIDILTFYNTRKKLEHFFKTTVHSKQEVSCAPPRFYADRFLRFMEEVFN